MTVQELLKQLELIQNKDREVLFSNGEIGKDPEHLIFDMKRVDKVEEKDFAGQGFVLLKGSIMITPLATASGAAVSCSPLKGVEILIMDAKTVDEVLSTVICPGPGIKNHTVTLRASAVLTGAAWIETSHDAAYTGQWNPLTIVNAADIPVVGTGAAGVLQFMYSNVTFNALRVRIETVIAGGTLSASYLGN